MPEQEELQLVVSLDDRASAQLEKLKQSISQLSGGQTAEGMERLRRNTQELSRHLRPIKEEAERATVAVRALGVAVGAVSGAIGFFAAGLALNSLKQFSEQMIELDRVAKQTGLSVGAIQGAINNMAEAGIGRGAAIQNIQGFSQALANLSRQSSEVFTELMRHTRTEGGSEARMRAFLARITGFGSTGDIRAALTEVMQAADSVFEKELERTHNRLAAAESRTAFLKALGMTPEMLSALKQSFENLTDHQIHQLEKQIEKAKEFNREWEKTATFIEEIKQGIQTAVLPVLTEMNKDVRGLGEAWGQSIGNEIIKTERDLLKAYGEVKELVDFVKNLTPGALWNWLLGRQWLTGGGLAGQIGKGLHDFAGPGEVPAQPGGAPGGIPPIGDLMSGKATLPPGAPGNLAVPLLETGWRGMPMSTNIEDRRQEQTQTDSLQANTAELKRLNDFLTATTGGAPGGALGFLSTQEGGLEPGVGGGTATAGPVGGPMGRLPGMGTGTPGTGTGGTPGTGTGGAPGTPSAVQWPAPSAGNIVPPGFGAGPGIGGVQPPAGVPQLGGAFGGGAGGGIAGGVAGLPGGPSGPARALAPGSMGWLGTVIPGAEGAFGGKPIQLPEEWKPPSVAQGGGERVQGDTPARFATVRYNNPGGMYPGRAAQMFGTTGTAIIGGGHKIAGFPTPVHGAAANMQNLISGGYVGMTIAGAMRRWSGGSRSVPGPDGRPYDPNMRITPEMARDPNFVIPFMKSVASGEAPGRYPMSDAQWQQAFSWYKAGGIPEGETALTRQQAQPEQPTQAPAATSTPPQQQGTTQSAPGAAGDANVPTPILDRARQVALQSGPGGVAKFMREQGYPKHDAWCGDFAASVVKSVGGTPPPNPQIASNWRLFGTRTDTPQPGDIAVRRPEFHGRLGSGRTGEPGSHVTTVESIDPQTGRFVGLGGNQGRMLAPFETRKFEFRRPDLPQQQQAARPSGLPAGAVPHLAEQQELDRTTGRELDKTPSVNVNGSGKISVEVKAPAGTKAGVAGEGLFKKTEMTRQVQMEPAASGPPSPVEEE